MMYQITKLSPSEMARLMQLSIEQRAGGRPNKYPFDDLTPGSRFIVRNVMRFYETPVTDTKPMRALASWKKHRRRERVRVFPITVRWINDNTVEFSVARMSVRSIP